MPEIDDTHDHFEHPQGQISDWVANAEGASGQQSVGIQVASGATWMPAIARRAEVETPSTSSVASDDLERFRATRRRRIALPAPELRGQRILITGGSGCVGRTLVRELQQAGAESIVTVARGVTPVPTLDGVEFVPLDVRDEAALRRVVQRSRPDTVFHLAAVREPALAELEPARAISTNVLGTKNVLALASENEVRAVVTASTGKALRYWTPDVYAISKKLAESVQARLAASSQTRLGAVRFTHIVDNSIIAGRLDAWASAGAPLLLHDPTNAFYVQSAAEAAQLLIHCVGLLEVGQATVVAQRDLGWAIDLLALAQGIASEHGGRSRVEVIGNEPGYESTLFPGTYGRSCVDASPLFNEMENSAGNTLALASPFDVFRPPTEVDDPLRRAVDRVTASATRMAKSNILLPLAQGAGLLELRWRLRAVDPSIIERTIRAAERSKTSVRTHRVIVDALRKSLTDRGLSE